MNLYTNAPAGWPRISLDRWDAERSAPNVEPVAEALDRGFIAANKPRPILLYVARLFREGFIPVPFEIVEASGNTAVFVYPNTSSELAAHYAAVKAALAERDLPTVYFAPGPLAVAEATVSPFRPFLPDFLGRGDSPAPTGRFGMWWSSAEEPRLSSARAFRDFERLYAAIDGIETYVFGALLTALGLKTGPGGRVALPEEMSPIQITGPDLRQMFFSATAEKGIRFRFSTDTPGWYRDAFWRLFTDYVETLRRTAESQRWPLDPEPSRRTAKWWGLYKQAQPMVEATGDTIIFGALLRSVEDAGGPQHR